MTHSVETVFSMEDTESSDYLSSCDSVYSLDSASSIEEDYDDVDVFLSDGCEEDDKNAVDKKDRQGSAMEGLVLSPQAQRVPSRKCNVKCLDHQYRTLRTGLQSVPSLQTTPRCSRYPFLLTNRSTFSNHSWATDKNDNVPIKTSKQNGEEVLLNQSVHRAIERDHQEHAVPPRSPGTKRPRERVQEGNWTSVALSRSQEPARTDGDRIFAQKCKELQGFIKPLMGLLNGLKRGRFERGLSTFQQSVAMDRIQRIIGVLQKPEMGERYLGTLLQVERMLKVWFPSVEMKSSSENADCVEKGPEHKFGKLENHNHSELKSTARTHTQRFAQSTNGSRKLSPCKAPIPTTLNETGCELRTASKESPLVSVNSPVVNLTWMHSSPLLTPPHGQVDLGHLSRPFGQNGYGPNLNSCGFILFVHNSSLTVPTYPRSASSSPNKSRSAFSHLKEHTVQTGDLPRSLSAPSSSSSDSDQGFDVDGGHSNSHSQLPTPSKKPETLNPWTWNLATDLKAKECFMFSS